MNPPPQPLNDDSRPSGSEPRDDSAEPIEVPSAPSLVSLRDHHEDLQLRLTQAKAEATAARAEARAAELEIRLREARRQLNGLVDAGACEFDSRGVLFSGESSTQKQVEYGATTNSPDDPSCSGPHSSEPGSHSPRQTTASVQDRTAARQEYAMQRIAELERFQLEGAGGHPAASPDMTDTPDVVSRTVDRSGRTTKTRLPGHDEPRVDHERHRESNVLSGSRTQRPEPHRLDSPPPAPVQAIDCEPEADPRPASQRPAVSDAGKVNATKAIAPSGSSSVKSKSREPASGKAESGGNAKSKPAKTKAPRPTTRLDKPGTSGASRSGKPVVSGETRSIERIQLASDNGAPEARERRFNPRAVFLSGLFHVAILIALAMCALTSRRPKDQISLSAVSSDPTDVVTEQFELQPAEPEATELPVEQAEVNEMTDIPIDEAVDFGELAYSPPPPPPQAVDDLMRPDASLESPSLKSMKAMTSSPTAKRTEFCGVEGGGNHFAYLVDSSGSMGAAFDSARTALLHSIEMLNADQRFYVVFFDSEPDYMRLSDPNRDEPTSVMATPENKRKLRQWAMTVTPDRGRAPYEPLEFTLKLRPDAIFLLSDGEFPQGIEDFLQAENHFENLLGDAGIHCIVHTIGYFSREGEARMRRIAQANRGQYRHIPRS